MAGQNANVISNCAVSVVHTKNVDADFVVNGFNLAARSLCAVDAVSVVDYQISCGFVQKDFVCGFVGWNSYISYQLMASLCDGCAFVVADVVEEFVA